MRPRIESGQEVTVEPLGDVAIGVNDIVLCRCHGREYLHLIKAVRNDGSFLIGNNRGGTNGWVRKSSIFGRCVAVAS